MGETVEIDFYRLGKMLLKRAWLIVLCAVIAGAAALIYTANFVTPQYTAEVTMYVNNNNSESSGDGVASSDLAVALQLVNTYVEIIERDVVLDKVVERLGLNLTSKQLSAMISSQVINETEMFSLTVTSPSPQMSADIANAVADIAPATISEIIDGSNAKVVSYAKVPTQRSSPNYMANALIGVLAGVVIAVAVIVLFSVLDVRIKNEEELSQLCGVAVLGVIPDFAATGTSKKARR